MAGIRRVRANFAARAIGSLGWSMTASTFLAMRSDTAVIESPAMCEPAHTSSRIGKILMVPLPIVVGNARAYEGPPGTHCRYTQQEEE